MQEELKSARNKYTLMREEVDVQRRKVDAKEHEAFAAQNMLVDLQEEVGRLRQQNKVVEGQKEALKTALRGEELARVAVEGAIGLPANSDDDEFASPQKGSRHRHRESLKENVDPKACDIEDELLVLQEELRMEKRMRLRADDQVHFMKMECQFQCCSCRVANKLGIEYVHDDSLASQMGEMAARVIDEQVLMQAPDAGPEQLPRKLSAQREISEPLIDFSPTSGTFHKARSPHNMPSSETYNELSSPTTPATTSQQPAIPTQTIPELLHPTVFPTPLRPLPVPPVRTVSHTTITTIPLKSSEIPPDPAPMTPGGISREEALEQIRQRRGRARSIAAGNGTPRKMMVDAGVLRRDISAPGRV